MAAVLELITEALVTVKALAVGETPDDAMTQDAMTKFNEVLEALSLQNLAIYASTDTVIPLLAGVARYTLGPGGLGQRPLSANSIDSSTITYDGVDFRADIIGQSRYDELSVKATTGIPCWIAFDNGFPNATISLYPTPERAAVLKLSQRKEFAPATSLSDTFLMPPGYRRMVRLMLAWELLSDYPGMGMDEVAKLQRDVASAIAAVKRNNNEDLILKSEAAWLGSGARGWGNWRDGT